MPRFEEETEVDSDSEIGYCQGCGRYGWFGRMCVRKIDGEMEECGEYL